MVAYIQFSMGYTATPRETQMDEVHIIKVNNTKDKYIAISSLKIVFLIYWVVQAKVSSMQPQ